MSTPRLRKDRRIGRQMPRATRVPTMSAIQLWSIQPRSKKIRFGDDMRSNDFLEHQQKPTQHSGEAIVSAKLLVPWYRAMGLLPHPFLSLSLSRTTPQSRQGGLASGGWRAWSNADHTWGACLAHMRRGSSAHALRPWRTRKTKRNGVAGKSRKQQQHHRK